MRILASVIAIIINLRIVTIFVIMVIIITVIVLRISQSVYWPCANIALMNMINIQGGSNPLREAASRGHLPIVQALIAAGADVDKDGGEYILTR